LIFVAVACGDDTASSGTQATAGSGAKVAACLDLSGTWSVASHCSTALVGMQIAVSQTACTFTTGFPFPGFTGHVQADGRIDLSGSASGMDVTCTGMTTGKQLTESCTGNCNVTLTR
jgi:hypothetical protein